MHTIISPIQPRRTSHPAEATSAQAFRQPAFECQDQGDALKLAVFVPGVSAADVDLEARGPDLLITARKTHYVRVNWTSLHLEGAQRDYQLRLRLGLAFDYPAMSAEIHDGVLRVTLPKRNVVTSHPPLACVA